MCEVALACRRVMWSCLAQSVLREVLFSATTSRRANATLHYFVIAYRFNFAPCYVCPSSVANGFSLFWICPDTVVFEERNSNSSSLKFGHSQQGRKGRKLNGGENFPAYSMWNCINVKVCCAKLYQFNGVLYIVLLAWQRVVWKRDGNLWEVALAKASSTKFWYCVVQSYVSATAGCKKFCNDIQIQAIIFCINVAIYAQ